MGQAYCLYKSGFNGELTADEVKENEEENRRTPGTKEKHDLFRTNGEIEIALKKETDGMIKIFTHQLGKAPIADLLIQEEIVKKIEYEQKLVSSNKELAKIYEQKIEDEINKLWQPDKKEVVYEENGELGMVAEE